MHQNDRDYKSDPNLESAPLVHSDAELSAGFIVGACLLIAFVVIAVELF